MEDLDCANLQKLVEGDPQPDLPASTDRPALSRDAHGRFLPGSPGRPPGARAALELTRQSTLEKAEEDRRSRERLETLLARMPGEDPP
ncbi:MAG TPA: hypothetical protein VHX64_05765 [Caulobacteraceae bacterium]|jgi:hypothetical protein|nr:hypothetical protein [Caulobacteraceae bacterium]